MSSNKDSVTLLPVPGIPQKDELGTSGDEQVGFHDHSGIFCFLPTPFALPLPIDSLNFASL
jgi:hypothetical protein